MAKKPSPSVPSFSPQERFINRETSWLAFNTRVMEEALNPANPLLERVKFLSISAANMDEFYMVRVAGLIDQLHHQVRVLSDDGLTAGEQLKKINACASALSHQQQKCWIKLRKELSKSHITVIDRSAISAADTEWLAGYFMQNIFPALTPIALDPAHPFPFLPNLGIAQLFVLQSQKGKEQIAVVPYPQTLNRFVRLPGKEIRFILLEDVVELLLDGLFPGYTKKDSMLFRIIRDSDLAIEEDAEDLARSFEQAMKTRRRGRVIRVKMLAPASEYWKQFVIDHVGAHPKDVVPVDGLLGLSHVADIYDVPLPDLKFPAYEARFPERITEYNGDCFAAIEAKDIVVHHPFESFDVVVKFLRQAAEDPDVVSIKQTLYRTSKDSPIIKALIAAADRGKPVTAVVELKARFDEEANLKWARDLERAGVQVVYGFVKLKTHAKVSLVVRRVEGKLKSYVHFGTGNYHPITAKIYTDLSYFTCNEELCRDAAYFFNFVTGYAPPRALKKLSMAPRTMRTDLLQWIEAEIAHVKAGRAGNIWLKMNSLVDPKMIEALYAASQAGVSIDLIVRGICCLRPGVKGLSETIRVKSIVGRFLEHSRIFCFGNGYALPSPGAKVFISSGDWMPRNFDWRVEVVVPIENPTVHEQIMGQIMTANLKDDQQSWMLQSDGSYKRTQASEPPFSSHSYFMHNPSLSGRGKAVKKAKLDTFSIMGQKKK